MNHAEILQREREFQKFQNDAAKFEMEQNRPNNFVAEGNIEMYGNSHNGGGVTNQNVSMNQSGIFLFI